MKRILSTIAVLYSLVGAAAPAAGVPGALEVQHFPEAAYRNEPVSFLVSGPTGSTVEVRLGDLPLTNAVLAAGRVDLPLTLAVPGLLQFRQGERTVTFDLVLPRAGAVVAETEGFLHSSRGPAILLLDHRVPPKHSRKWEPVKVLRGLFCDDRPQVSGGWFLDSALASVAATSNSAAGAIRPLMSTNRVSVGLNGVLEAVAGLKPADVVVVRLSAVDLERGTDGYVFRMKLEWLLQALADVGIPHVFVAPPTFTDGQRERFRVFSRELELAASAHGATVLKELPAGTDALKELTRQIEAGVKLKRE